MITLSSDFGDPYPAAMKGVLRTHTDAELIDVSHRFPRQDVRAAAFWLTQTLPYFPPATHLVVVDPGVGTERAALVVRAGEHALVGPDNGVLLPAARELGNVEVFEWHYDAPASNTFHGRDVFAPAAAQVHEAGVENIESLDHIEPTDDYVDLALPEADVGATEAAGEVLVVDDFGNVVTNVPGEVLARAGETVAVNGEAVPTARAYAERGPGERLVTVGSHGNVELAVREGRGDDAFGLAPGDAVGLEW
jgi:S-adenosylmethionine hydrolase